MTQQEAFGRRLRQLRREKSAREEKDIEQSDVAEAIGDTQPNVARWEKGRIPKSDDTIRRLAAYYGVTAAWLRLGEGPRKPLSSDASRSGAEMYYGEEVGTRQEQKPVKKAANDRGKKT